MVVEALHELPLFIHTLYTSLHHGGICRGRSCWKGRVSGICIFHCYFGCVLYNCHILPTSIMGGPQYLKNFFFIGPVEDLVNFSRVDPVEHTYTYEYIYIIFCVWGFILNWGIQSRRFLSLSKNDENVYKEWSLTISTLWKQCPSEKGTFHKLLDRKFFKNMHTTCTQYAHNVHGIFIQYVRNVNA